MISARLAAEKKRLGYTNKMIAERSKLGISEETIARVMNGKIANTGVLTFTDICEALGMQPYEAFFDETLANEFKNFLELKAQVEAFKADRIRLIAENATLLDQITELNHKVSLLETKLACAERLLQVYDHFIGIKQEKEEPTPSLS